MKGMYWARNWSAKRWIISLTVLAGLMVAPWLAVAQLSSQTDGAAHTDGASQEYGRYVYADLSAKVIPSVVTVYVKRDLKKSMSPDDLKRLEQFKRFFEDPQLRQFFQQPGMPGPNAPSPDQAPDDESDPFIAKGSGSGVIISDDGYVITNWHVVGDKKDNSEIRVVLSDNTELSGKDVKLIESSPLVDLALIKINRTGLKSIPWGDSDALRIGERVCAVGSPLDLRMTVTQGIICAKHREVGMGLGDMLQTDAVINPGSSGGALVNLDGKLIGINRMITTPFQSGRWEGYGFAIPAKDVKYFVDEVLAKGKVAYGYIGVEMATPAEDSGKMREAIGLKKELKGVLVKGVRPGTPAAEAGLQEGDLIVSADGNKIENSGDLLGFVARRHIGSLINLGVVRGGGKEAKDVTVSVKIAERPSTEELTHNGKSPSEDEQSPQDQKLENNMGLSVEPYTRNGVQGVRVTGVLPDSPAAKAGVQEGDVLLKLNRVALKSSKDLAKAIKARPEGRPHLLQFMRQGQTLLTPIDQK